MNAWVLRFEPGAEKELGKLDASIRGRIIRTLDAIAHLDDPRARGKSLTGNLAGFWRYRIGDYRVICQLVAGELVILVVEVAHRREVYR